MEEIQNKTQEARYANIGIRDLTESGKIFFTFLILGQSSIRTHKIFVLIKFSRKSRNFLKDFWSDLEWPTDYLIIALIGNPVQHIKVIVFFYGKKALKVGNATFTA